MKKDNLRNKDNKESKIIKNSIVDIEHYLSVSMQEFRDFWDSCSEEEKNEFKKTELSK